MEFTTSPPLPPYNHLLIPTLPFLFPIPPPITVPVPPILPLITPPTHLPPSPPKPHITHSKFPPPHTPPLPPPHTSCISPLTPFTRPNPRLRKRPITKMHKTRLPQHHHCIPRLLLVPKVPRRVLTPELSAEQVFRPVQQDQARGAVQLIHDFHVEGVEIVAGDGCADARESEGRGCAEEEL